MRIPELSVSYLLDESTQEKIILSYLSGKSSYFLSSLYGVSPQTIVRTLRRHDVVLRSSAVSRRSKLNHNVFDELNREDVLYWCGFIFTDGHVSRLKNNKGVVSIGLSIKDFSHLEKFKFFLNSDNIISTNDSRNGCSFKFTSSNISKNLLSYGRYTSNLHPNLFSSHHFWRGAIDGDGSLFLHKKRYPTVAFCGQQWLVDAFRRRFLLSRHTSKSKLHKHDSIYLYQLSGNVGVDCIRWLYGDATVYLDRKYETAQRIIREYG